jgi:hypothetical protein
VTQAYRASPVSFRAFAEARGTVFDGHVGCSANHAVLVCPFEVVLPVYGFLPIEALGVGAAGHLQATRPENKLLPHIVSRIHKRGISIAYG